MGGFFIYIIDRCAPNLNKEDYIMGCGCGKNASRNTRSAIVPNITQTRANGSIVNTRSLNPNSAPQSPAGLSLDKREVERIREEAIKKALGK